MDKKKDKQPESNEALEAVDAVVKAGRKNFFQANMIWLKGDTKKERLRKTAFDLMLLIILGSLTVLLWYTTVDRMGHDRLMNDLLKDRPAVTEGVGGEFVEPVTRPEANVRESAEQLLARNKYYKFWVSAPGGGIEYPVVQYSNNAYYLHRNFNDQPSRYGNPFMDYRNSIDPVSDNLIIYGHNMFDNATIFSRLESYMQRDTVARHPILTLEWPDGSTWQYKIFAVVPINGRAQDDNDYVFHVNTPEFGGQENFEGYLRQLAMRTLVQTGVDVRWGDNLLTLQTCLRDYPDQFLYIVGRQLRPGESIKVDPAGILANPNPRHPQIVYNRRGVKNPYENAEQWQPPR